MPSVSKAQQRFMGLVHAYKKGEVPASKVSKAVKDAAKSMKKKSTKKFASTKHDDLPNKVRSENMNEDGHTDVASIERKLKLIIQDSVDVIKKLRSMSNEDSLPSWWTDKITLAKDYVGKSRDFIMNPTEEVDEGFGGELTGEDKKKFEKARKENAEQLGYKVTGTSDIKESVINEKIEPKVKSQIDVLQKRLKDLKVADARLEQATWETIGAYAKIYSMVEKGKYLEIGGFKQIPGSLELLNKRFSQKFSKSLDSIVKSTRNSVKRLKLKESVNEATSLGADMLLGGIATVVKKAGMRPKSAKMMGGGFKVSKRDKVGFKIDVEIRGLDKKKTFPLQFETERGMLYVVIKNKPIKLGKYTMVNQAAQNLKKVGAALIGDKNIKRIA